MIKNIIFDLGNVLLDFKPEEFLLVRYSDLELQKRLYQEIFQSEEWILLDKGILKEEEAIQRLTNRYQRDAEEISRVFQSWMEMLKPIPGTIRILEGLKKANYKLYVLSNFHLKAFERVFKENEFFKCFDGMIISAKEKTIKPEARIYERLISRYDLDPKESIFIDDTMENLKGAEKLGFRTILFRSPSELSKELKEYGIMVR